MKGRSTSIVAPVIAATGAAYLLDYAREAVRQYNSVNFEFYPAILFMLTANLIFRRNPGMGNCPNPQPGCLTGD